MENAQEVKVYCKANLSHNGEHFYYKHKET